MKNGDSVLFICFTILIILTLNNKDGIDLIDSLISYFAR